MNNEKYLISQEDKAKIEILRTKIEYINEIMVNINEKEMEIRKIAEIILKNLYHKNMAFIVYSDKFSNITKYGVSKKGINKRHRFRSNSVSLFYEEDFRPDLLQLKKLIDDPEQHKTPIKKIEIINRFLKNVELLKRENDIEMNFPAKKFTYLINNVYEGDMLNEGIIERIIYSRKRNNISLEFLKKGGLLGSIDLCGLTNIHFLSRYNQLLLSLELYTKLCLFYDTFKEIKEKELTNTTLFVNKLKADFTNELLVNAIEGKTEN